MPPWLALVQRFNAERDHDYEELGDQCAALVAEVEREQAKGRFTFAAPGRADAEADLERAAAAVDDFAAQVAGRADSDRPREPG